MRFVFFYHSLVSDWNHGNAHFLRGICQELLARGHDVRVYEPDGAWSRDQLLAHEGRQPIRDFYRAYPRLGSAIYDPAWIDLDLVLDGADVVLVHEWNDPALVRRMGEHRRRRGGYRLLFHDTHHRAVSDPRFGPNLDGYDGVLAFGRCLADLYRDRGWCERVWVWHEAADTRRFRPLADQPREGDLVWIGNWGDGERTAELEEYLFRPVEELGLAARVYGVRYPAAARHRLAAAGIGYAGWVPNYRVPEVFARFGATVHVPRRPYAERLPGIPTIRVFEALACGIPLVSAPWDDCEGLFTPGEDYLVARSGREMREHLAALRRDPALARRLAARGRRTVEERHSCRHRVDELLALCRSLGARRRATAGAALPAPSRRPRAARRPAAGPEVAHA